MFKRIVLATAFMVVPLVLTPTSVDAQERGPETTAAASAQSGLTTSAANGRSTALPPGMENRAGDELPPGLVLTREAAADGGSTSEGDSSDGDGCVVVGFDVLTGEPIFDCGGAQ